MAFSSITFLVYFLPCVILIYHFLGNRFRNAFLLIASVLFYSWGAPRFIFVIIGTTALDFLLVKAMDKSFNESKRKLLMILSISINLGLLFYFKYCNFFVDNLNHLLSFFGFRSITILEIILPIGISFYTFESLTYVVDVYRRIHKPLDNFWNYLLYIILFPKLIAGPIIRYHEIADQISNRVVSETVENRLLGFFRFTIGLSKKIFIANTLAVMADNTFHIKPEQLSATVAWTGMLAYTFQIYFDFSGYSDMAIGLGRIFGFKFPENFNNPYISGSVTEFWRRWHMTLGSWMKNYLYLPLGGNRVESKTRLYLNLCLVFLASGLWHGASWTFIFWGAYHGTFIILERIGLLRIYGLLPRVIPILLTFFIVSVGWVFFRADSMTQAFCIIQNLGAKDYAPPPGYFDNQFIFYFILASIFSFFTFSKTGEKIQTNFYEPKPEPMNILLRGVIMCLLFTLAVASLAYATFNPFIYFRF